MMSIINLKKIILRRAVVKFPPATNMKKMRWDENLAILAEKWAKQCKFEHDLRKNRPLKQNEPLAQNIFRFFHGNISINEVIDAGIKSWNLGITQLNVHKISVYLPSKVGEHFVNMIWANSNRVKY